MTASAMDSPHHTAKLLSEAFAEPILRELHAILSERFAAETPSPAGLRAMAAQLVKLPAREMSPFVRDLTRVVSGAKSGSAQTAVRQTPCKHQRCQWSSQSLVCCDCGEEISSNVGPAIAEMVEQKLQGFKSRYSPEERERLAKLVPAGVTLLAGPHPDEFDLDDYIAEELARLSTESVALFSAISEDRESWTADAAYRASATLRRRWRRPIATIQYGIGTGLAPPAIRRPRSRTNSTLLPLTLRNT